ncbi:hypothetical protein MJT46_016252 [Ovis ammon polii x Ovis aries]|nr:hypothetical protein MJT46_016252 [Ovis ammon polii x Ovis aries]
MNPERTPSNSNVDGPVLRPSERVPKVPVVEMRDPFAACSGEIPGRSRRISRVGALHRKGNAKGTPGSCHQTKSPPLSQSIPEDLFSLCCLYFHAEDRLRPRWHVGQLCTKSSCESLKGNPRGKATDSMIDVMASVTLLLQLGRKAHVHASSQEED